MSERYCIDRLEGGIAVLQRPDESCFEVKLEQLPANVQEGDQLFLKNGTWQCDPQATQQRKEKLKELLRRLGRR